ADAAGGEWPQRARKAAEASRSADDHDASRLELLLEDIRDVFKEIEMSSADLVKGLVVIEGRPWAELGKSRKPLTQNGLARMLKPLRIGPGKIGPETKSSTGTSATGSRTPSLAFCLLRRLQNRTSGQNAMKWALLTISKWTATSLAVRLKNARNPITTAFCPPVQLQRG